MTDRFDELNGRIGDLMLGDRGPLNSSPNWGADRFDRLKTATVDLIEAILLDETKTVEVGHESYHHDNGFTKLVLARPSAAVGEIRLHHWESGTPERDLPSNVHDHTSSFTSVVLNGVLHSTIFARTERGPSSTEYQAYLCHGRRGDQTYSLTHLGGANLQVVSAYAIGAGQIHFLHGRILHRIVPLEPETISLVIQGPRTADSTSVFNEAKIASVGTVESPELTIDTTRRALRRVREHLRRT